MTTREPIGEIACPLCKRAAELHEFAERTKLNPDADGGGKPTYPKKFFVVCPPTSGYRGCGTIMANGALAQGRLMELGRVFGPGGRAAPRPASTPESQNVRPEAPPPPPPPAAKPAPARNPFKLW